MSRKPLPLVLALIAAAGISSCRKHAPLVPEVPEWTREIARTREQWLAIPSVRLLRGYVQVDTSDPPGHERLGAEFLKGYLDCEGVPSQLVCAEKDRCNLYARLPGRDHERALLLLSHIDVFPVYPPYWHYPPFGGVIDRGYMYGRGVLDMKSIGIAQMLAFVDLAKSGIAPDRDVILLAECGEEYAGTDGVGWIFEHRPDLLNGVTCVLNEGGYPDMVAGQVRNWGIEIGNGGLAYAMVGADDENVLKFPQRFRSLDLWVPPSPPLRRYFESTADFRAPFFANAFRHPELLKDPDVRKWIPYQNLSLVTGGIVHEPPFRADLVKAFDFGKKWDAVVSVSLPLGIDPRPYLDRATEELVSRGAIVGFRDVDPPGRVSRWPTADTDAVARVFEATYPGVPVVPVVNAFSSTTSVKFRARHIDAYGVLPFMVDSFDAGRRHGNDERLFLPFYTRGVDSMREIVFELSTSRRQ